MQQSSGKRHANLYLSLRSKRNGMGPCPLIPLKITGYLLAYENICETGLLSSNSRGSVMERDGDESGLRGAAIIGEFSTSYKNGFFRVNKGFLAINHGPSG